MGSTFEGGTVLDTPAEIEMFQLLRLRSALGLEIKGLRHSQGSVYAHIKRHYGLRGNKQRVFQQFSEYIDALQRKGEATGAQEAVLPKEQG